MALDYRGRREGNRGVAGWERLAIASVRTLASRGKLDGLDQQLRQNLRLDEIHAEMRRLRLIEDAAECVGSKRQGDLLRRVADVFAWCERRVHRVVVADQARVER